LTYIGGIHHVLLEQSLRPGDGVEVVESGEEAVGVIVAQGEALADAVPAGRRQREVGALSVFAVWI
jgi:hypothetical protein